MFQVLEPALFGGLLALLTAILFAWKWQLGLVRTAVVVTGLALLSTVLVGLGLQGSKIHPIVSPGLVWLLTLSAAFAILAYCFYRDPERVAPDGTDVIVSPADGEVLYVRQSHGGRLPFSTKHGHSYTLQELTKTPLQSEDALVIGIGMSFLDVHVNRAPISGQITLRRHFPGRFGSLRRPEMVFENERVTTIIERDHLQVAVVQIASRLVRQIVSFLGEGDGVLLGQRIGMIRFGSQVDLVIPAQSAIKVIVQPGQRLIAGHSIVAVLDEPDPASPAFREETFSEQLTEAQLPPGALR